MNAARFSHREADTVRLRTVIQEIDAATRGYCWSKLSPLAAGTTVAPGAAAVG